ncbi:hypothetical protein QTP70_008716 [Hemibagrus guttatus]|uniref:RRM domain-containing protein n=1 Tax=Hemibagrus guttatus TaxID=175788 RepID=A0AAE0R4G5_9TELE|nr:hypothetical protein QTP70_008716 [Hemibagrus guttatus]
MAPTAVVVNPGLDRSGLHICCDEPLSFTLCPGQLAWRSRNFRDSSGRQKQRSSKAAMASAADGIGGLGTEQTHVNVPVADPSAWATAMNNLGIMPMGLTGQQLVSDSICIQGFDPNLGIIAPINPMMAGISLVPPPPVQPELPVIKEIIHCKSCTLFPQNPNLPPPSTRERPPGCKTVFVGGLPENASEEIIREVFDQCGEIVAIRKSKKNFCHIRFSEEFMVDKAIYLSGYRMRIGSSTDKKDSGRIHVDFAQARDDLYEWECKQRLLAREERHRRKIQEDRLRPPSPPPIMHYSEHEAGLLAEKLKGLVCLFVGLAAIVILGEYVLEERPHACNLNTAEKGLFPVGHARNTSPGRRPGGIRNRCPSHLNCPLSMWRSSGSTPSSSRVTELLTLSLRECPATLRRKLVLAACIRDLTLSVMTQSS